MHHQFGGLGAPRQPREQVRADRADHVVPPVRQHAQRQAGEIRVLLGQQLPDELSGDIDLRGGHTMNGHHMTIRGSQRPADPAGQGITYARPPRMYTGVPGVGTSVWKNAAMWIGIRTQPWEAGRRGTWVSPWIAKMVPMKNTGLYIPPSGAVTQPGMYERVVKSPVGVMASPQPFGEQK